jgi:arylsulfatase
MTSKKIPLMITVCAIIISCFLIFVLINKNHLFRPDKNNYNILLLVADALRKDVLGCYGGDAQTPNIDWLAQNGALFTHAYCTSSHTIPSSIAMFTGNYAKCYSMVLDEIEHEWTKYVFRVPSAHVLFGETFQEYGIETQMSMENNLANRSNNTQGFSPLAAKKELSEEDVEHIEKITGIGQLSDKRYEDNYGLYHYLLSISSDTRFFIVKWFMDPHTPYDPPEKYKKNITENTSRLSRDLSFYMKVINLNDLVLSEDEQDFFRKLYISEVESIDERVGMILRVLRAENLLERTFIVFTSDHGECLGEPGKGWKHGHRFWQEIVNVPLIYSGPGIKKGLRIEHKVSHIDLMPTLSDLMRVRAKQKTFGRSYAPLLYEKDIGPRDIFLDSCSPTLTADNFDDCGIMEGDVKYWRHNENNKWHDKGHYLYDINDDPGERNNLIDLRPEIARKLHNKMASLLEQIEGIRERNILDVYESFDIKKHNEETLKELRALGYIK